MIKTVRDAWQIPELRRKILFTIFALLIFRLGAAIPVPYINTSGLETYLSAQSGTILGLMNAMSGSAFSMATLFALSIQPYINSSIIIQLLTVAIRLHHPVHHRGHRSDPGLWLLQPDQQLRPGGDRGPARRVGGHRHHPVLHCRLRLPHVAGRADHRVRHRQRHLCAGSPTCSGI